MQIYFNDKIVPEENAKISVFDRGFLFGDGVYETMRSYDGEIFQGARHMSRLTRSASVIGIQLPMDENAIMEAVHATMQANELTNATIRITVSRGTGPRGIDPTGEFTPTLVIMVWPFAHYTQEQFEGGISLITANTRRTPLSSFDISVKSCNFLNNIMAKAEASRAGVFDALMLNTDGFVAECTVSNIFFISGGELYTPSEASGILGGITREHVISLARGDGLLVNEGLYDMNKLFRADEVFLTSTTMEVMPVSRIDETSFKVGQHTRDLMAAFKDSRP